MVVLLIGSPKSHEGRIAGQLRTLGVDAAIFDSTSLTLHPVSLEQDGAILRGGLETDSGFLEIDRVTCVWMGQPAPIIRTPKMDLISEVFALEEWAAFYRNLFALTADRPWVNSRDAVQRSEAKLFQTREAAFLGIATPPTLVTSDPSRVGPFLGANGNELALKMLNHLSLAFRLGDSPGVLLTNRITSQSSQLEKLEQVRLAPAYLQRYVGKQSEARAWVVGNSVFATEIFSQDDLDTLVDWRRYPTKMTPEGLRYDTDRWRCEALELPEAFQRKLVMLARRLGLTYTAIDLIRRHHGDWVFLEANDGGSYAWGEDSAHLPITNTISDLLAELSTAYSREKTASRSVLSESSASPNHEPLV